MKMKPLGRTDILVSDLCLGTMTYGTQTDQADASRQMDMALEAGINFIDTAEMYPVTPISAATQGDSERMVGVWGKESGKRGDVIIATKMTGAGLTHVRGGAAMAGDMVRQAVEGSLKRLQTDVIDLYQLHWPNRGHYGFRQNWTYDPSSQNRDETLSHMVDMLEALQGEVDRGTIRAFGLSNETAWGMDQWLRLSQAGHGPRAATIQNEYSLLYRTHDLDLAELSANEDVGLLAYSPLGTGLLTGKYMGGAVPKGSRLAVSGHLSGRHTDRAVSAVQAYVGLAEKYGLPPTHLALGFCQTRPFMGSVIFGATTAAQLNHIIEGKDVVLSQALMKDLDRIHRAHPMPY